MPVEILQIDKPEEEVLDSFTTISILDQGTSTAKPTSVLASRPVDTSDQHPGACSTPKPLSEIQNIAYYAQPPVHPTSTRDGPPSNALKRTSPFQFGTRYLQASDDVFAWNAWDHVDPSTDSTFVAYMEKQYAFQREHAASEWDKRRFQAEPQKWWDKFYGNNAEKFFKDRKWLRQEFPVLGVCCRNRDADRDLEAETDRETALGSRTAESEKGVSEPSKITTLTAFTATCAPDFVAGPWNTVLEIGAGVGNTAFPLLKHNRNQDLMIHAVDFSIKAVHVMQESELFDSRYMTASHWDMASDHLPRGLMPGSIDVVVLIFAFSALSPKQWTQALRNVYTALRPGGEVCFRDYGRGDLAQVRFKKGRWLGENFYVRGDGTRVYFFDEDELRRIWSGGVSGAAQEALVVAENSQSQDEVTAATADEELADTEPQSPVFEVVRLATDRRLLVNRQKQLKMYRCWMQGRFRKPLL